MSTQNEKPKVDELKPSTGSVNANTNEPETITIGKDVFDKLLDKLDSVIKSNEEQGAEIEMLKTVADQSRLSRFNEKNKKGSLIRTVRVGIWDDLPIIGWKKVKDEVGFRENRMQVDQRLCLFLDDGNKKPREVEVDYLYWAQNTRTKQGEVTGRFSDSSGEVWTIQFEDGSKVNIDIRFINPF